MQLQKAINDDKQNYSLEIVKNILSNLNISVDKFLETRKSAYTQLSIDKDLKLAKELQVETTPTTFVFNYDCDNCGLMIEGNITRDKMATALANTSDTSDKKCNHGGLHLI